MKNILSAILCGALLLSLNTSALAAEQPSEVEAAAAYLRERGVMMGGANGDMMLEEGLTRVQLAALLTRLHGEGQVDPKHYTWACYYTDVPEWAKPYVGYCTAMLLVSGYGDEIYGSNDPVTPAAACTVALRACGYEDGEGSAWNYQTACAYAVSLGLLSEATVKETAITRGDMAVLLYRALMGRAGSLPGAPPVKDPAGTPQYGGITIAEDGTITSKVITQAAWSREDFSQQANPAIFTGCYTREWYNAIRQSIVDRATILAKNDEKFFNPDYLYAHTLVPTQPQEAFSSFCRVLGMLDGVGHYTLGAEPYTKNQYEYPGYTIIKACRSEGTDAPLAYIQPKLNELAGRSDREKVTVFHDWIIDLIEYGHGETAGVADVFSDHMLPVLGKCGSYANAFSFLCDAAAIPCITIASNNHAWNEVYVDGRWLVVDVTFDDVGTGRDFYLLSTNSAYADETPQMTRFAKELLVPGSTIE